MVETRPDLRVKVYKEVVPKHFALRPKEADFSNSMRSTHLHYKRVFQRLDIK